MKITVLMGGTSSERDVSIVSGVRVAQALRETGHEVVAVDTATGPASAEDEELILREGVKRAPPSQADLLQLTRTSLSPKLASLREVREADVVFLALHGGQGEDGTIQALLDLIGVVYTGSGHMASALAMDKDLSKHLFRQFGVPTPNWMMAPASDEDVAEKLGFPVVVKPSREGSTVGLTVVREPARLQAAIAEAERFDREVMIEEFIAGRELTVGILGSEALAVGEILPEHEIYDYECKYTPGMAREEFPAQLAQTETDAIKRLAERAFAALKLGGCARIDFRMATDGTFYCLEANTLPGLTQLSLVPQAAAADGISFPALCERIVHLALESRGNRK